MQGNLALAEPSTAGFGFTQTDRAFRRARGYIAKLHPAIAGQGGHNATMYAACRLVEFGLAPPSAWTLLLEWNQTHCRPPWSEDELLHKLQNAYQRTSPKPEFTGGHEKALPRRPATRPSGEEKRPALPPLRPGTRADSERLAALRCLGPDAIALASERGLLRFGAFRERPAWFVLDMSGRVAQARRLDGLP